MVKKMQTVGRVVYLSGVKGAIADIRNGCQELLSAVHESKDEISLLELRQIAADLALELQTVESAASAKIDKL